MRPAPPPAEWRRRSSAYRRRRRRRSPTASAAWLPFALLANVRGTYDLGMAWRRQTVRRVISAVTLTALAACSESDTPAGGGAPSGSRPGGAIDSAFGTGGTAAFGSTSNDTVNAALGTSTDATVVVGSSLIGDKAGFLLMRVRGDGSLDPTFGTGGRTVSHVGL